MKRLLLFTAALPLFLHAMEPEEKVLPEPMIKEYVAAYISGGYRWVKLVDEQLGLAGNFQNLLIPSWRTSEILAQEILQRKPAIKKFIRSQLPAPFKKLPGHDNGITSAQFSADGARLVTGSKDGTAKIWDTNTGQILQTITANCWVIGVAFSFVGDLVMTLGQNRVCTVWKCSSGQKKYSIEGLATWPAFSPASATMLTGSRDGKAYLWNTETGALLATLAEHKAMIASVRYNRSGNKIVTESFDGTVKLWDEQGNLLGNLNGKLGEAVGILGFSSSGRLITALPDYCLVWDVSTKELLYRFAIPYSRTFSYLGPEKILLGDSENKIIQIFDIKTGARILRLQGMCGALSPTGDSIIDDGAQLYSETGELIKKYPLITTESLRVNPRYNKDGDKVLMAFGATGYLLELAPLLLVEKFFKENITLQQVALLNDLFEIVKARQFGESLDKQFEEERNLLIHKTFDFKRYPGLWADYQALPEVIRNIFDPFVLAP